MTTAALPVVWRVTAVVNVVDGDTVDLDLERDLPQQVTDLGDGLELVEDRRERHHRARIRLTIVDTPERTPDHAAWARAREDLATFLGPGELTAHVYGRDVFGRYLADLTDVEGDSASEWLIRVGGWPPYVRGQ